MTDEVLNPSPVPIRLGQHDGGTYGKLAELLAEAARLADDRRAGALVDGRLVGPQAQQWIAVRDALRAAAHEALVPRGGTGGPVCRRCGTACPECNPVDEPADVSLPPRTTYVEVALDLVGYGLRRYALQAGQHHVVELVHVVDRPGEQPQRLTGTISAMVAG